MKNAGPTEELIQFIVDLKYDDIPEDVLTAVRTDVLDFFGNALGGSSDDAAIKAYDFAASMGGAEQCTVIAGDLKLPAPMAGLVNGTMGFALDYDDTHDRAATHLGTPCIPAAFAVAQMVGGVSGKDFLTALTGAMEVTARLGSACNRKRPNHVMGGWDYAELHGCFTATGAAGKLLGLNTTEMLNAYGIAYHQISGQTLSALEEGDSKKLGPGFAARDGLTSALMAKAGLTGAHGVFAETDYSLFQMYHDGGDAQALVDGIGQEYVLAEMGFKPYPCCRLGHRHIDAVLKLMKEHDVSADEISKVYMTVCPQVNVNLCEPREGKLKPESRTAAQFSLPWVIACACLRGKVGVAEFLPEAIADAQIIAFTEKVHTEVDSSLKNDLVPAVVRIETTKGTWETMTTDAYGTPQNPFSAAFFEQKFRENVKFCRKELAENVIDDGIAALRDIDNLSDVASIVELFS